ncbi:hypothetical protein CLOACE_02560 [Clostridium acetireducens DSM 10703]|uniref:Polymer-forming cytoskeletal n=1 Tax=Clostridium acetireducens DSM 10703 TaxID=1121290 RepID=A0A1E8F1F2_9CLOT|nr:polymer-forming cytoskeletal protein [Clostridium acetireducens]OFI07427.1 hypothetical protein CLOACE_02560 [Clostridium acetireducens DSM 10703]
MKKFFAFFSFFILILFISIFNVKTSNFLNINSFSAIKFGENIYVQPNEVRNSNILSLGGDIYINGNVNGNVTSLAGNIYVNGNVNGNVKSIGGSVTQGINGNISGKIKEVGKNIKPLNIFRGVNIKDYNFTSLFVFIILGLILYGIIPYTIINMAWNFNNKFLNSLQYGYIIILLSIFMSFVFTVTIIGILILPFLFLFLFILFILGVTSLSIYIGKKVTINLNKNISELWCMIIGMFIIGIIKNISFASIGQTIYLLIITPTAIGLPLSNKLGSFGNWTKNYRKDFKYEWDKFKKR